MPDLTNVTSNFFPTASETYSSTLSSGIAALATSVPVTSAADYAEGAVATITVDAGTANEATFTGVRTGSSFTSVKWTEGNLAVGHTAGAPVVDYVSATHLSQVSKGIQVQHNQDGTHKAITATSLTTTGNVSVGGTLTSTGVLSLPAANKTTDANGWTVYNYGAWKEYSRVVGPFDFATINADTTIAMSALNLPVGKTVSDSIIQISVVSTGNITVFTFSFETANLTTATSFTPYIRNVHNLAVDPGPFNVMYRVIDR